MNNNYVDNTNPIGSIPISNIPNNIISTNPNDSYRLNSDGSYEYYKCSKLKEFVEKREKEKSFISTKNVIYTKKIASGGYGSVYYVNTNGLELLNSSSEDSSSNISSNNNNPITTLMRGRTRQRNFDESDSEKSKYKNAKYVLKRNLCDKSSSYSTQIKECNYLRMFNNFPYFIKLSNVVTNIKKENEREVSPVQENVKDDLIHFVFPKSSDNILNFQKNSWANINYIENLIRKESKSPELSSSTIQYLENCHYKYDFEKSLTYNYENMIHKYFEDVFTCMVHILLGLEYLHKNNIIHRDIKLQNILYDSNPDGTKTFRLCDFGFMRKINGRDLSPDKFTPGFYPPESIFKNRKYTTKVDVWTVGLCLYVMLRHRGLFSQKNDKEVAINEMINKLPCDIDDLLASTEEIDLANDILYEQNLETKSDYNTQHQNNRDKIKYIYNKKNPDLFLNDFSKPSLTLSYLNNYVKESLFSHMGVGENKESKYPYTDQVQKLLINMLHVNANKRYTASMCLDMPLFNKWRSLIEETRKKYIKIHKDITIYERPKQITDKINTWISVLKNMINYCEDLYIVDYVTIGNFVDCVDKICYAFHTKTFNVNNPYPFRISGMFHEDKKLISCDFDHMMTVLAYMIIKLQWHDSKIPYEEFHSILKKAHHKHHSKTGEKLTIEKILPKYFSYIELSILHACDGMMYGMNFIDLAKFNPNISLKNYCNEYLKFTTLTPMNINASINNNTTISEKILNVKIHNNILLKPVFEQKEYNLTFCSYLVDDDSSYSSMTIETNIQPQEIKITPIQENKINTNNNTIPITTLKEKSNNTFETYQKRHFTGITDERLARLFPSIQNQPKNVNIEQVKSSRASGSYTCKELREKLNALGISYNTRQKKKELAELLRNSLNDA